MEKIKMERRSDLGIHPDDVKKERKRPTAKKKKKYSSSHDDKYWVEDDTLFKAVSFVRSMVNSPNRPTPIGLAIFKSARYYKIPQTDLAKEMGRLGSFVRESRRKY